MHRSPPLAENRGQMSPVASAIEVSTVLLRRIPSYHNAKTLNGSLIYDE